VVLAKKALGQHFLSDPNILKRIVDFSQVGPADQVLEIGPGKGTLTQVIAERASRVVAIEIDHSLFKFLSSTFQQKNIEVLEQDALDVNFDAILPSPYHLVSNLPYNITSPLLERLIGYRKSILSVTVMIQAEVADRILAKPGSREYSPLSIGIQYYAHVESGFKVPPGAFTPRPKVHSKVIRLTWRNGVIEAPALMTFVKQTFSSRRKKLINNLCAMYRTKSRANLLSKLSASGIDTDARPENLSVDDYIILFKALGN